MHKPFILLILAVLLVSSNSQCTAAQSTLSYMITGVAELGAPTDTSAREDYSIVFSSADNLGLYANIFSAFSIVGLQTTSGQNFYSVVVDQVVFSNNNRVMRFIMDYNNNAMTVKTQWNKIKLCYIVVSPEFQGISSGTFTGPGNSYVFAKGIEYNVSRSGALSNQAIDTDPVFNNDNGNGVCGYIESTSTLNKAFGTNCPADAQILYHYYIMGFRYDSTSDSTYEFRVSVRGGDGLSPNQRLQNPIIALNTVPNGPRFTVQSYGGNLKTIKIGIVLTVLRDYSTYPTNGPNVQTFKYSGVFMPVSLYNNPIPITVTGSQNLNRFDIGYNKYVMYGFSSIFVLPNSYIDFNLQVQNLYQLQITSQNMLSNVIVSADFYSSIVDASCTSSLLEKTQVRSQQYTSVPPISAQQTFSKIPASNGILTDALNEYVFDIRAINHLSNTDTISMTVQLVYDGLSAGKPYMIQTAFDELSATDIPSGTNIRYTVAIDGSTILNDTITTNNSENDKITKIGRNIATTTATFVINIQFARNSLSAIGFKINFALFQVSRVYDSILRCCSTNCSSGTGLNVNTAPFTCLSCNSSAGQFYNSMTGQCECSPGYFLISSVSQICTLCSAKLCSVCNPSSPSICQTCVSGASLQFTGECTCNSGLFASNNACTSCGPKCNGCDSAGKCLGCSDSRRDPTKECNCPDGFYESGGASCLACSSICKTCTSSNVCTSCDPTQNRRLEGGLCVCVSGFYSSIDSQNSLQCLKCATQCESCFGNPWTCNSCDPAKNKVAGYDSFGRLTCLCAPGYNLADDGSCIQTDCTKDPYCLQCSNQTLRICLACKPSINRVLDTTTYSCVCRDGFYPSATGQCLTCPTACATCTSSTVCRSCVAGASRVGNTCSCASGSFFVLTPIRYCKSCQDNCLQCNSTGACIQCLSTFQLTTDGKCLCGPGRFTNVNGQCTSCLSETCATCRNATICLTCITGYLLQQNECISRCSEGFYRNGSQCLVCSSGCAFCTTNGTCIACNVGLNLLNGRCYSTCPPGTLNEQSSGRCVACNPPCRSCVTHPSVCTSCEVGVTLNDGKCVTSCSTGTYALNGLCMPCDFSCATCMGSARVCTSCAERRFLWNGACYDFCPKFDSNGNCVAQCSPGFYQSSNSVCSPCGSNCQECTSQTQCTRCQTNLFSYLGDCLATCPSNTLTSRNNSCLACDVSCRTCQNVPTQCLTCSTGYVYDSRLRRCLRNQPTPTCTSGQFLNILTNQCQNCNSDCLTCSERNQCLSCPTGSQLSTGRCVINSTPISQCQVTNCARCNSNNQCTQCSFGFFLNGNSCVRACPYPTNALNGVCKCASGILYESECITSCPSGFTAISGTCQKCASVCKQCSEQTAFCTACNVGFQLNVGSKQCELVNNVTCPYGQYQEGTQCLRFCNNNLVYQNGLCYTSCLTGYVDNRNGGCVLRNSTNCVVGQFLLDGNCVTSCPVTYFANSTSGRCTSCPENCNQCSSATICNTCTLPYVANSQGACIFRSTSLCASGQFQLNGNCLSQCPLTFFANTTNSKCESCPSNCNTCSSSNTCTVCASSYVLNANRSCSVQSTTITCAPGIFELNGFCFSVCPSGYWANRSTQKCDMCPQNCAECSSSTTCTSCKSPFVLRSGACTNSSGNLQRTCNVGFYLNTVQNLCYQCRSPCVTCSSATVCQTCVSGFSFSNGQCLATSCSDGYFKDADNNCQICQSPCNTCSSLSVCTTCVSGFQLNGNLCQAVNTGTGNLIQLSGISVDFSYRRGTSVIVRLSLPVIPSGLTQDQRNRFFDVKQSNSVNRIVSVTQWIPDNISNKVFVMVNYASIDGSTFLFLSVNTRVMSGAYGSLGYFLNQKSYRAVSVFQTMEEAPASVQVPISAVAVPYAVLSE